MRLCVVCVCVYIYAIMNDLTIRQQQETRREQRVFHGLGIPPFFWQLELVGIFFSSNWNYLKRKFLLILLLLPFLLQDGNYKKGLGCKPWCEFATGALKAQMCQMVRVLVFARKRTHAHAHTHTHTSLLVF